MIFVSHSGSFLFIIYYELGMPSIKYILVSVLVPIYMRVPVLN